MFVDAVSFTATPMFMEMRKQEILGINDAYYNLLRVAKVKMLVLRMDGDSANVTVPVTKVFGRLSMNLERVIRMPHSSTATGDGGAACCSH